MIKKILLAVDGSATAKKAADYTLWLAKNLGAKVSILHVIDERLLRSLFSVIEGSVLPSAIESIEENLKNDAKLYISQIEDQFRDQGVSYETFLCSGDPSIEIVREAENMKVDLIILGTHGKGLLESTLLGSVAYGVIHYNTKIPILIIPKNVHGMEK